MGDKLILLLELPKCGHRRAIETLQLFQSLLHGAHFLGLRSDFALLLPHFINNIGANKVTG